MDNTTIIIIGLVIIILALLDDLRRKSYHQAQEQAKAEVKLRERERVEIAPVVYDGFIYPWWRNYYFPPRGYYWRY